MNEEYEVRNVSEDLVDMQLDECINKSEVCKCARCRADIRAYALNNFPPRYVVTDFGDAMSRVLSLSLQFQADIVAVIMKGILVVRDNPHH